MGVMGRKPKPDHLKRNNHPPTYEWVEVLHSPYKDGRKLPTRWANNQPWPARTRQWWRVISAMPHCVLWTDSDWEFAVDTAFVHASFVSGDLRQAAELRNRDKLLGTTFDSRRDLRIRYVDHLTTKDVADGDVSAIDDYRTMLSA